MPFLSSPLVVARADLPRLGQLRHGDRVRLRALAPTGAVAARTGAARELDRARSALAVMRSVR